VSLALADTQTPLPQLLHGESYLIQEMADLRGIHAHVQRAQMAMLARDVPSLRSMMLGEYFRAALARWHGETELSSLLAAKRDHPAYRQILDLGEEAIPLILREIQVRPSFIFMALHDITGEDPIASEHRGRLPLMIEDWLKWGSKHGFRQ
jgi:hypothetical protein